MVAKKMNVDFSKVKDGGNFNKKRIPSGDYLATITKVEDSPAKGDGIDMLLFSIKIDKHPSSVLPYYCKITENQLWKLRNIFIAAGKSVPKRKISVDPNSIVGKKIGVTIEDTYYEEKDQEQSEVGGVFPATELDDAPASTDDDEVDLDSDEDESTDLDDEPEAEEAEEEVEEEAEEEAAEPREGLDRTGIKRAIKALDKAATFKASESDDDLFARLVVLRGADAEDELEVEDEEEEEAPAPVKKTAAKKPAAKKKPAPVDDEDDLDGIDIDEL